MNLVICLRLGSRWVVGVGIEFRFIGFDIRVSSFSIVDLYRGYRESIRFEICVSVFFCE